MTKAALAPELKKFFSVRTILRIENCMHRVITRYDVIFHPHICTEFINEHSTSFVFAEMVYNKYINGTM